MTIAKHKKGPWVLRGDDFIDSNDGAVCSVAVSAGDEDYLSTANLIMAAPEMYGLLCSAVRELDQLSQANRSDKGSKHPLATKIRSLLARLNA